GLAGAVAARHHLRAVGIARRVLSRSGKSTRRYDAGAPGGGALQSPCPPASAALRPPPLLTAGGHRHPTLQASCQPYGKRKRSSAPLHFPQAEPSRGREAFSRR